MLFKAINTKGEEVTGTGILANITGDSIVEGLRQKIGRPVGYITFNYAEWYDGTEFYVDDFDIIFLDTLEIVK